MGTNTPSSTFATITNRFHFMMLFMASLSTLFTKVAFANFTTVGNVSENTSIFYDFSQPERLFTITKDGNTHFISKGIASGNKIYSTTDADCALENLGDMKLAYPFFVALDKVCILDETRSTIHLLTTNASSQPVPENAFSVMYFGEDKQFVYFLMNGRPWDTNGYLKLRTINKTSGVTALRDLVTDIPGFSAGMWNDGKDFFLTTWDSSSELFSLNTKTIWQTIANSSTISFNQIATKIAGPFDGLSPVLLTGANYFLFDNDNYEGSSYPSYVINRTTGASSSITIPQNCLVIAPAGPEWLLLCQGGDIKKGTF